MAQRGQSKLDQALGTHVVVDSTNIPAGIIVASDIGAGAITNTEVNVSADIAVTKLKEGTADQVVKTNTGGTALEHGKIDNANITASTIQAGAIHFYKSGVLTGSGTEQSTAHGLGRTPALVLILMQEGGVTGAVTEGTHDGTSVLVTVASGMDYKIVAL